LRETKMSSSVEFDKQQILKNHATNERRSREKPREKAVGKQEK
jgi:hypothetical protein